MGRAERRRQKAKERKEEKKKSVAEEFGKSMDILALQSQYKVYEMVEDEMNKRLEARVEDLSWKFFVYMLSIMAYILHNNGADKKSIENYLDTVYSMMNDHIKVETVREYVKTTVGIDLEDKYLF